VPCATPEAQGKAKVHLGVRLDPAWMQAIDAYIAQSGMTYSTLIRKAISDHLKKEGISVN
jgi:predicted DNA binding CopG/RHH family protein